MDPQAAAPLGFILLLFGVGAYVWSRFIRVGAGAVAATVRESDLEVFARERGLAVENGMALSPLNGLWKLGDILTGSWKGVPFLETEFGESLHKGVPGISSAWLELAVDFPKSTITSAGWSYAWNRDTSSVDEQPAQLDYPGLDEFYNIGSVDQAFAARLVTPELERWLMNHQGYAYHLGPGQVRVSCQPRLAPDRLPQLLDVLVDFYAQIPSTAWQGLPRTPRPLSEDGRWVWDAYRWRLVAPPPPAGPLPS